MPCAKQISLGLECGFFSYFKHIHADILIWAAARNNKRPPSALTQQLPGGLVVQLQTQSTDVPQNNLHICYRAEDINTSMVMPVLCIASTAKLVLSSLQYVGFFFLFSHACCNPGNRQHPHRRRLTRAALFPSGTKKGCKHFTTLKANETTQI